MVAPAKPGKNRAGFSIAESLVAAAILAVVLAGIMSFVSNHSKAEGQLIAAQKLDEYLLKAETLLQDPHTCRVNLQGRKASNKFLLTGTESLDGPTAGVLLCGYEQLKPLVTEVGTTKTETRTTSCTADMALLKLGDQVSGMIVSNIEITREPGPLTSAKNAIFNFVVTASNAKGGQLIKRSIYFRATTDGNSTDETITDCPGPTRITDQLSKYLCDATQGRYYDVATNSCMGSSLHGFAFSDSAKGVAQCPKMTRYQKDKDGNLFMWTVPGKAGTCHCLVGTKTATSAPTELPLAGGGSLNLIAPVVNPTGAWGTPLDLTLTNAFDLTRKTKVRTYTSSDSAATFSSQTVTPAGNPYWTNSESVVRQEVNADGTPKTGVDPDTLGTFNTACGCSWATDLPTSWGVGPVPAGADPAAWAALASKKPASCTSSNPIDCLGTATVDCTYDNAVLHNYFSSVSEAKSHDGAP